MNFDHIIHMGGYGVYVWTAYSITLSVFVINWVGSLVEKKRIKKLIQQSVARFN